MVRFWSVLPERRPVHLLEEPEDGAELGGGAVRAFSELVGVRRGRLAELQGDFFHQCRIAVFSIKPTFLSLPSLSHRGIFIKTHLSLSLSRMGFGGSLHLFPIFHPPVEP